MFFIRAVKDFHRCVLRKIPRLTAIIKGNKNTSFLPSIIRISGGLTSKLVKSHVKQNKRIWFSRARETFRQAKHSDAFERRKFVLRQLFLLKLVKFVWKKHRQMNDLSRVFHTCTLLNKQMQLRLLLTVCYTYYLPVE